MHSWQWNCIALRAVKVTCLVPPLGSLIVCLIAIVVISIIFGPIFGGLYLRLFDPW